ncbi:MAG: 2-oxoacid:acceptor oxidoreductase family protein [Deltaproteobacteria bacterium]|nr:2-oxoacid:acceptor oxidoreductase family protein [Deltaproteobacteria bacterium]
MKKTIFAGFGGQGVLMMGYAYAVAAMNDGMEVTYLPSYGAEMRGGTANCTVAVSDEEIYSPVASSPDHSVILNKPSLIKFESAMIEGGLIILNSSLVDMEPSRSDIATVKIPANDLAKKEFRNERTVNMIMLGAFVAKTGMTSIDSIMKALDEVTKGKNVGSLMKTNLRSLNLGADYILQGASR